jgi:hypothetical protein
MVLFLSRSKTWFAALRRLREPPGPSNQQAFASVNQQEFIHAPYRATDGNAVNIPEPPGPGRRPLYDLGRDPGEVDLAARAPGKLDELLRPWAQYVEETGVVLASATVFEIAE